MPVNKHDIEKYVRGELSHAERHALEKQALRDPFLADALEGAEQLAPAEFSADVARIHDRIRSRVRKKFIPALQIAAGIAVLLGIGTVAYFYQRLPESVPGMAQQKNESAKPVQGDSGKHVSMDSVGESLLAVHQARPPEEPRPAATDKPTTGLEAVKHAVSDEADSKVKDTEEPAVADKSAEAATTVAGAVPAAPQAPPELLEREERKAITREESPAGAPARMHEKALPAAAGLGRQVEGQVVAEEDGSPLPGVNVVLKGTTTGTVTGGDGRFQLPVGADGTLVFSFVGLQSIERPVSSTPMIVKMPADVSSLSEVVVTGYGVTGSAAAEAGLYRVAAPQGGRKAFNRYLEENLVYPAAAREKRIEGNVIIQFNVQPGGQLGNFMVIKGIGGGCEEELIRLVKDGPIWTAELNNGRPAAATVRVRFTFRLSGP